MIEEWEKDLEAAALEVAECEHDLAVARDRRADRMTLAWMDGQSVPEVAEAAGLSVAQARRLIAQGRARHAAQGLWP